jgi:hypothetical protein
MPNGLAPAERGERDRQRRLKRHAGQSDAVLGDSGVEGDDPPGFEFAIERIENAGRNQLDRGARGDGSIARNREAKAAALQRGLVLVVVRDAVMVGVFAIMLMNTMMIGRGVRAFFMHERRVFELNERSFPRPADDKRGGEKRDENRALECTHDPES